MKLEEIEARIREIALQVKDDEVAHGMEDSLRHDFIKAIFEARIPLEDVRSLAGVVLRTEGLDFERWCA